MNDTEAATLVSRLVAFFPGTRFDLEHARAYESGIRDLEAQETQDAIEDVVRTALYIPPIAAIRSEVMRRRRLGRVVADQALRLPATNSAPTPAEWGRCLTGLLESSARHQRMVKAWTEKHGGHYPADPAQPFIELAQAGAAGEDVRRRLKQTVLGDTEEAEELERRFP